MIEENKHRGLMLVGYQTSSPVGGVKDDRGVTAVADTFNATKEVGTFTRRVIPARYLRPFTQVRNKWAKYHRQVLVPYSRAKKGMGLGKTSVVKDYCNEFRNAKREAHFGIDSIMMSYQDILDHHRENAGDLFVPASEAEPMRGQEIPVEDEFRELFVFKLIEPQPLENPEALIDVFDEELVNDVRGACEGAFQRAVADSLKPVFSSLHKMSKSLKDYDPDSGRDGAFRKTLVTNLKENAELLSKVNFADNEMISHIQDEILENLVQFDERQLKESESLRHAVSQKADEVLDNFEMFGLN
tara:strand:- start:1317 stop:2216 length:900 start_codon:yes stop_codon:yes gene_type:complete